MSDAGEKPDLIPFDFHPSATAISSLPSLQFAIDKFKVDEDIGR